MVSVIVNVHGFAYKPSGHHFTDILSENIWFSEIMILFHKNKKIYIKYFECGESFAVTIIKEGCLSVKMDH